MKISIRFWVGFHLVLTTLASSAGCTQKTGMLPEPSTSSFDIGICPIPDNYPFLFEPHLAVYNGNVAVGFIGLSADPTTIFYKRRVFFTNLRTLVSPAEIQYGPASSTGGADPSLDFDAAGNLYAVNIVNFSRQGKKFQAVHFNRFNYADMSIVRSAEIGLFAEGGRNNVREPDKCWIRVNKNNGHIYIAWSGIGKDGDRADIYFVRSTDGGASFSPPYTVVSDGSNNFYVQIEQLVGGQLILVWDARGQGRLRSALSSDDGLTFTQPSTVYINPAAGASGETMGPVLTRNTDGSLELSVSILKNNSSFRTVQLRSADGLTWNQVGEVLDQVFLSSSVRTHGKTYVFGYKATRDHVQFGFWGLDGSWQPRMIKLSNSNGFRLNAGDYIANVPEGRSMYSAYTFISRNGKRNIYITKTVLP